MKHQRGFYMYSFVFYSHKYYPHRRAFINRKAEFHCFYETFNKYFHLISVGFDLTYFWPDIMFLIHIIPVHLINTHSKDRLKIRVYSFLDYFHIYQFVDKKSCCMSIIKYHRMTCRFTFFIKDRLIF